MHTSRWKSNAKVGLLGIALGLLFFAPLLAAAAPEDEEAGGTLRLTLP